MTAWLSIMTATAVGDLLAVGIIFRIWLFHTRRHTARTIHEHRR